MKKYKDYHKEENRVSYKKCIECLEWYEMNEDNFGIDINAKSGFNERCKICKKLHDKKYYQDIKNGNRIKKVVNSKPRKGFNDYIIYGDITVIFLENSKGLKKETLIDTEDLDKIKNLGLHWHMSWAPKPKSYYATATQRYIDKNGNKTSRTLFLQKEIMNSDFDIRECVNHLNHDTLDNRKCNLEVTSIDKNSRYREGRNSNNKSGYRNVCWLKDYEQWCVQLQIDGKNTRLGFFDDVHEAGKFAEEMRQKYYKEHAGNG